MLLLFSPITCGETCGAGTLGGDTLGERARRAACTPHRSAPWNVHAAGWISGGVTDQMLR